MATNITPIDPDELIGKGVTGLPDSPELSTLAMQQKFDELAIDIIIPHINGMCDEIDTAIDGAIETAHAEVVAEQTRAQAAESALSTAITAETTRAQTAEGNLSDLITAETNRAIGVENGLSNKIGNLNNLHTATKNNLVGAINEAMDTADIGLFVRNGQLMCRYEA